VCNNFKLLFFPFFPFFGSLVDKSQKKIFSQWLLIILREETPPRLALFFLPHKDIQSHRNKKMFALTTQFAGVQVVSKTAAPKKSVNKVVSVRVFDCQYVYFDALSRALLVFAERFLFVRAFWKVNSLSRVFGSHSHESEIPTRARSSRPITY